LKQIDQAKAPGATPNPFDTNGFSFAANRWETPDNPRLPGAGCGTPAAGSDGDQAGRKRRNAAMPAMTKSTSTTPWVTANGGSLGGTLGASSCNTPIFRKL